MVKAFSKKESKRMTCHKKYKIRKKVREHNKKLAKTLKKSDNKKKKKGDGHIPNAAPFKEELLLNALEHTEAKKDQKFKSKNKNPSIVTKKQDGSNSPQIVSQNLTSYKSVISQSGTLLWVIDIRSVEECFLEHVYSEIINENKTVIFILNKVDLVPESIIQYWYAVFSQKAPTYILKSTQILLSDCEQIIPALKQILSRFGGIKPLLDYLKKSFNQETTIGIIGTPKVGKSCVVSSILKGCGRTKAKNTNTTKISDNLRLATVSGTIPTQYKGMLNILQNINSYMNQPSAILTALSHCISKEDAMYQFTLPEYNHPEGFSDALAIRYNLIHNKEPDHAAVGRLILKQLRDQKLKFYVRGEGAYSGNVVIPEELLADVKKFLYVGEALRINSSEINVVIPKKVKNKKNNEMDVDEDDFDEDGVESDEEGSEEERSDDDSSNDEMN